MLAFLLCLSASHRTSLLWCDHSGTHWRLHEFRTVMLCQKAWTSQTSLTMWLLLLWCCVGINVSVLLHFARGIVNEMYIGYGRLCLCLSVPRCILTFLHGPGCNLGDWLGVPSSCALLGGFAFRGRVSFLRQHTCTYKLVALYTANAYSAEREMSDSGCTHSMAGLFVFCCCYQDLACRAL